MAQVEYVTENEKLYETFQKGPKAGMKGANCDLFRELFKATIEKAHCFRIRWMPSHLNLTDPRPGGVSDADIFLIAMLVYWRDDQLRGVSKEVAEKYIETY